MMAKQETLFGWPGSEVIPRRGSLCVFGAPAESGNPIYRGTARAPAAIREASRSLAPPHAKGVDWGDPVHAGGSDATTVLAHLAQTTARVRAAGLCPLMLGGDHSLTFAPVSTLQAEEDLCLVWFDAHTDFSLWSGHASHNHKQVLRRVSSLTGVRRVLQVGYRGITTGDERQLGEKATVVTSAQARAMDTETLLALVPRHLPCYISIDIDVIDPLWAPGTGAPVPDGLSPATVATMLIALVTHRQVVGIDLVEVNPVLDHHGATSTIAANLLRVIADHWHRPPILPASSDALSAPDIATASPTVEALPTT